MVAGLVNDRYHQFGRQSAMGTPVAAVKRYGFKGVPDVNMNWTEDDVDEGSIDPMAEPFPVAPTLAAQLTSPSVRYNDLPLLLCGVFGGAVDPTGAGTAQTWAHDVVGDVVDAVDPFTYENGDDVDADTFQLADGLIESLEIAGPEGLGPCTSSAAWRFGHLGSKGSTDFPVTGTVPTADLSIELNAARLFLKDMGIYISTTVAGLATGQILSALHSFTWRVTYPTLDEKRYADGDQSFDVDEWGRAARMIEYIMTFAKTSDIVGTGSESDAWLSKTSIARYLQFKFTSEAVAETGMSPTYYSWQGTSPVRYFTRETTDAGGNSVIVLTARARYDGPDGDLGKTFESILVCTQDEI